MFVILGVTAGVSLEDLSQTCIFFRSVIATVDLLFRARAAGGGSCVAGGTVQVRITASSTVWSRCTSKASYIILSFTRLLLSLVLGLETLNPFARPTWFKLLYLYDPFTENNNFEYSVYNDGITVW